MRIDRFSEAQFRSSLILPLNYNKEESVMLVMPGSGLDNLQEDGREKVVSWAGSNWIVMESSHILETINIFCLDFSTFSFTLLCSPDRA